MLSRLIGQSTVVSLPLELVRRLMSTIPLASFYDLAVIGGGSGGLAAARQAAAKYGKRVVLIEGTNRMGGTCVNLGCVPKKIMYNAASLMDALREVAPAYCMRLDGPVSPWKVDWGALVQKREAYIRRLNGIYCRNLERDGVDVVHGWASFVDKRTLRVHKFIQASDHNDVNPEMLIKAEHILVATGSRAIIPDIPGANLGITSDGFFALKRLPRKVGVIGSGYVGVELAGVLHSLGTEVDLWCRKEGVLSHFDPMICKAVTEEMQRAGINVRSMTQVQRVCAEAAEGSLTVCFTQDNNQQECHGYDAIIWAIGRAPYTEGLNLESLQELQFDKAGHIVTDEYQNTSVEGVYSLGDVTGRFPLTPVAIAAGRKLVDRLFGAKMDSKLDYLDIPTVVFSHPEPCGTIGLTEPEARSQFGDAAVKIYETRFVNLYYAMMEADRKHPTLYKLVCVGPEERVAGLHLYGRASDEILQGFAVALRMGATKEDFDRCVAIHPTAAEELVTMK